MPVRLVPPLRRSIYGWVGFAAAVAAAVAALVAAQFHFGDVLDVADYAYPAYEPHSCAAPSPTNASSEGPRIVVRAPANYDPQYPHPLLVVFSPAGFAATLSERHLGLTRAATAAGLIVAFVDSRPLSVTAVAEFARVPGRVARQWCVDPARVTLAGHSDGGTVAEAVALLHGGTGYRPAAVMASAAGLRADDFAGFECPQRLAVQLWHGRADSHFPGYGASAAAAWADCLRCAQGNAARTPDGCMDYAACQGSLRYCEHDGGHLRWPAAAATALVALAASARRE